MKRQAGFIALLVCMSSMNAIADAGHDAHAAQGASSGEHWMAPQSFQALENPIDKTADSIERGRRLFAQNCAVCHGEFGEGDGPQAKDLTPPPANLREMADQHADGDFFWKISSGRGAMPGWKGILSEEDIWHLVNFIKSLPYTAPQKPTQFDLNHGHRLEEGHH